MTLLTDRPPTAVTPRLATWTGGMKRSLLRQMIGVVSQPGILSLAGGLPAPELFPTDDYAAALQQVLAADPRALQYAPPFPRLREHIVDLMARRGILCRPDQIFLTTGAQQGLDIITRLLLEPGRSVLLESLIYTGAQQVVAPFHPRILTVGTDLQTGLDVDAVASLLAAGERPAYIYTIPESHNPLGMTLTLDKRRRLVQLARQYGVPLVEDDAYGFLRYDGRSTTPLRAMDDQWVFYLGSFSKILAPALRLGWLVAPEALLPRLNVVKEAMDLESSALTQRAVAAYLDAGHFPDHLARLRAAYDERRQTMLQALADHFPPGLIWTRPQGGMFVWVEGPTELDTAVLLERALAEEQVAFIPGHAFAVDGRSGRNCLRLNFSNATPDRIADGVQRLGRLLKQELN